MDFKILLASFALVFVAELGDKTQLTAMALTTSSKSGWMVFVGTSLALIATTALAVVFGAALTRWVPQNVLHIASAAAFILIGMVLLINVARKAPAPVVEEEEKAGTEATRTERVIHSWVAKQAVAFEQEIIDYLEELTPFIEDPGWKAAIQEIVEEDKKHLDSLTGLETLGEDIVPSDNVSGGRVSDVSFAGNLKAEGAAARGAFGPVEARSHIELAVEAEENLADFYLALARKTKIHAAKDAFRWLSMEDIRHAQRLCALINPDEDISQAAGRCG